MSFVFSSHFAGDFKNNVAHLVLLCSLCSIGKGTQTTYSIYWTLLEKFWRISLHVTDDAFAKLFVTKSLVT